MIWKKDDLIKIEKYNTTEEENKYYIIELDKGYLLECLTCKAPNDFSKNDICFFKEEKDAEWKNCSQENFELNEDILEINLYEKYNIQFLKINKIVTDIQVFIRKYRGLIISTRRDGFCCRIGSMINAMYIAEKIGFKFGFLWEANNSLLLQDKQVISPDMSLDNELFQQEFIDKYSYKVKSAVGTYIKKYSFEELKNKPYEHDWGYFCTDYRDLSRMISEIKNTESDYLEKFSLYWDKILLKEKYKNIRIAAHKVAKEKKYIALHIRNGEGIFHQNLKHLIFTPDISKRVFPYEIAIYLIKESLKNKTTIILFGADLSLVRSIKMFFNTNKQVYISEDFIDFPMDDLERTIFDLELMSYAEKIYKPIESIYSEFAYRINKKSKIYTITEIYSTEAMYNIIEQFDCNLPGVNCMQKAASYAYLYNLSQLLSVDSNKKMDILNKGIKCDPENFGFYIKKLCLALSENNLDIVKTLSHFLMKSSNRDRFFKVLFRKRAVEIFYFKEEMDLIIKFDIAIFEFQLLQMYIFKEYNMVDKLLSIFENISIQNEKQLVKTKQLNFTIR
ncbi:TPA: hypothetical protein RZK51_001605, partial [Campylobacter coli]|nr:hypothetical protein [Campylobacter coli]